MRKLICKVLTFGRHHYELKEHRYRCVFCETLRMRVRKAVKAPTERDTGGE